jgi:hypothetical protein
MRLAACRSSIGDGEHLTSLSESLDADPQVRRATVSPRIPSPTGDGLQAAFNQRFANESMEPNANICDRTKLKCQIYLVFPMKWVCS